MSITATFLGGGPVLVMLMAHVLMGADDRMNWVKALAGITLISGIFINANPVHAFNIAVGYHL